MRRTPRPTIATLPPKGEGRKADAANRVRFAIFLTEMMERQERDVDGVTRGACDMDHSRTEPVYGFGGQTPASGGEKTADQVIAELRERVRDAEASAQRARDLAAEALSVCIAIDELREEEADSIEILCDNPDADSADRQTLVAVIGRWTDWQARDFHGRTWREAVLKAMDAKRAAGPGVPRPDPDRLEAGPTALPSPTHPITHSPTQ